MVVVVVVVVVGMAEEVGGMEEGDMVAEVGVGVAGDLEEEADEGSIAEEGGVGLEEVVEEGPTGSGERNSLV